MIIEARGERWPLAKPFTIARGSKTEARVVVVTVRDGAHVGRGEAVPYARYGESVEDAIAAISALDGDAIDRRTLLSRMKAGAARNAVDCALWDLEAKASGVPAFAVAGLSAPAPLLTAYTISLAGADDMATAANAVRHLPLLKLKLGAAGDAERLRAVRAARPDARLIADANEAWTAGMLHDLMAVAAEVGIETIEQPLPEHSDEALRSVSRAVPICADESLRTAEDLPRLEGLYDAINIKLDKAGGLTAAFDLKRAAKARTFKIMIGSMVATSLAVAPAMLLAADAEWIDLDGPMLLAKDREFGVEVRNGVMSGADRRLWG